MEEEQTVEDVDQRMLWSYPRQKRTKKGEDTEESIRIGMTKDSKKTTYYQRRKDERISPEAIGSTHRIHSQMYIENRVLKTWLQKGEENGGTKQYRVVGS